MIKPLKDYILCEEVVEEEKTESGIFIAKGGLYDPNAFGNIFVRGKVLAGKFTEDIKVGDIVLCTKHKEQKFEDKFIISEKDILAVYESTQDKK